MDIEKVIEEAEQLQLLGDEGENRRKLRKLLGLKGDGYGISFSPEILECVLSKAQNVMARGNKIILASAMDGALWFNAVCSAGYDRGSSSAPSVFGPIFRSRAEALSDSIAEFRERLEKFPQNTPREIKLVETLQKWLDKIEAENVPQKAQMDIEKVIEEAERLKASGDKFSVLGPLRELFGLEGGGFEISYKPEVLRYIQPNSKKILNNQIILDSVLDGALWFSAVCAMGYDYVFNSSPTIFSRIFRSRAEALDAAVREFRGQLEDFSQNTPREKRLVEDLNNWLDRIEAENIPQKAQMEDTQDKALLPFPPAREGEQLRLGSREDGFVVPEDLETERQKKIRSELEAVTATRKQMGMLQKAYNRQELYLSIVSVIEEARSRSAGSPGERILVADVQGRMRVLTEETARDFEGCYRVVYAAFLDGAEVDYKEREGRKDDARGPGQNAQSCSSAQPMP